MEEAVAEHRVKKTCTPRSASSCILVPGLQRLHIGHRDTVNALHYHHAFAAVVGVHLRHVQHRAVFEITPQLNSVGGFPQQVQLIQQRFSYSRTTSCGRRRRPSGSRRGTQRAAVDELHVRFNDRQNIRADNLDHHLFAILFQTRGMHWAMDAEANGSTEKSSNRSRPAAPIAFLCCCASFLQRAPRGPATAPADRQYAAERDPGGWKASGRILSTPAPAGAPAEGGRQEADPDGGLASRTASAARYAAAA